MTFTRLAFVPLLAVACAAAFASSPAARVDLGTFGAVAARQDGRTIEPLRWTAPSGEQPQTYAEYLALHPPRPARFSTPLHVSAEPARGGEALTILVESELYPQIEPSLAAYIADLEAEGHSVILVSLSGGSPGEVRNFVQGRYADGGTGVLLVGDIPAAWMEVSGASTPCDLFYMDVDGYWADGNGDGVYDYHIGGPGDEGPEMFVARLYTSSLTYGGEADLVNDYLAKAHAYRTGALQQNWGSLEYVDEDWYSMDVAQDLAYGNCVERHDGGWHTTAAGYLDRLSVGRHFVQVCAHSYSGGHHFGMWPTEAVGYANTYIYSPNAREATLRVGADDGVLAHLNGENVLTANRFGGWTVDQFQALVSLDQGWNQLLCKISQRDGSYCFSARITDADGEPFPDLHYQLDDPQVHDAQPIFITRWLLNGLHRGEYYDFYDFLDMNWLGVDEATLNPQAGEVNGGKVWTEHGAGGSYVDFTPYDTDRYGVMYAFVRIHAPADTSCRLRLGYDDGVRVWLNGEVVLTDNRKGSYVQDMTEVEVTLHEGENRLLLKVSQHRDEHGASARFASAEGVWLPDLSYDPAPSVNFIGEWLLSTPFHSDDQSTLLFEDYLEGESTIRPSRGDPGWHAFAGYACPLDLGNHYNGDGGWIFSSTIQQHDPPALFYNLFACGPGFFTDSNYLAGAYIFNTTWGLITIASARSGSMLYFDDFMQPLGAGETMGAAFRDWFDAQAPFSQWEREWYYGLILNGDPLLTLDIPGDVNGDGSVGQEDLGVLLAAYGTTAGDPAYVAAADVNGDGSVSQPDLGILLSHYGYTRP